MPRSPRHPPPVLVLFLFHLVIGYGDDGIQKHENILNVSRVFWITVHEDRKVPQEIWPGVKTERYLGLRGSESLVKYLTPRAKQNVLYGRDSGKELPSWNAVALYLNHVEIWKRIRPGEIVAIFEEDAEMQHGTKEILESMESLRIRQGNHSWFYGDSFYLTMDAFWVKDYGCKKPTIDFAESQWIKELPCHMWYGTSSYLIGAGAARELLESVMPIDMQIDAYVATHAISKGSKVQKVDAYALYTWRDTLLVLILGTALPCFGLGYATGWLLKSPGSANGGKETSRC
eukprot:766612-Hanusia_phi.AAC.7